MRTNIFILCLLAMCLIGCKQTNQPVEPNTPGKNDPTNTEKEMETLFNDCISFLSANYKAGDIVSFETEDGSTEEMCVWVSEAITEVVTDTEIPGEDEDDGDDDSDIGNGDDDEDDGEPDTTTPSDVTKTYITNIYLKEKKKSHSIFSVAIQLLSTTKRVDMLSIETDRAEGSPLRTPAPSPTDNTLVLQTDAGWCCLQRNVGIIQIADTLGHTWKLVK